MRTYFWLSVAGADAWIGAAIVRANTEEQALAKMIRVFAGHKVDECAAWEFDMDEADEAIRNLPCETLLSVDDLKKAGVRLEAVGPGDAGPIPPDP
jgi:hypothetical protein